MAGKQTKTPRRTTRSARVSHSKSPSSAKKNKSRLSSPKTPGWVSGKNAVFKTPKLQSPSPRKPKTRRSSVYHKKATLTLATGTSSFDKEFTKSLESKSNFYASPESPFGIQTRTRFSIYRKGGMRLVDIPLSPPKGATNKSISAKRRTRRSSVYHKSSKPAIVNIPLEPFVTIKKVQKVSLKSTSPVASPPVPALRAQNRKKVTAKRITGKSPIALKSSPIARKITVSKETSKRDAKITSPQFTAIKSPKDSKKTPLATKNSKTPKSVTKKIKRKLEESDNSLTFSSAVTPLAKRAKHESPMKESPPKSTKKRTRRIVKTPNKSVKTPAKTTKSPVKGRETSIKATKTPAKLKQTPLKVTKPEENSPIKQSPAKKVSPVKSSSTAKSKMPLKKEKSPNKSLKTPVSAVKRKRETDTKEVKAVTPPTKRARKRLSSGSRMKLSPVVILTKTPAVSKVASKDTPSRKMSASKSTKSLKTGKSPRSLKKMVENKHIISLKKSGISPHVKVVTPVSTPNLLAKKRISQRKSTPARVPKTPRVPDLTPIVTTPKINTKSLLSRQKPKFISDEDLVNDSIASNSFDLKHSLDQSQDEMDAYKTIYLDSVSSPVKDVNTTFGSFSGRTGRCIIL